MHLVPHRLTSFSFLFSWNAFRLQTEAQYLKLGYTRVKLAVQMHKYYFASKYVFHRSVNSQIENALLSGPPQVHNGWSIIFLNKIRYWFD